MKRFDVTVTETRKDVVGEKYPVTTTKKYKAKLSSTRSILEELLGDYEADEIEFTVKVGTKSLNVNAVRIGLDVRA